MIDFKKLMDESPEAKTERAASLEQDRKDFEARITQKISDRTDVINRLHEAGHPFNEFETNFVRDLHRKSTAYDMTGTLGGNLSSLSEKQMNVLNAIADKYLDDNNEARPSNARRVRP